MDSNTSTLVTENVFVPHETGIYDPNMHAFPQLSSNVSIDVTKFQTVYVSNIAYRITTYIWAYSIVGRKGRDGLEDERQATNESREADNQTNKRYIGAILPAFESALDLTVGTPITDKDGKQISCITARQNGIYGVSGLAYETFDAINIPVDHHTINKYNSKHGKIYNSIYGNTQAEYSIIKELAKEYSTNELTNITKYNVWIGDIVQITGVGDDGTEMFRVRFKKKCEFASGIVK